MNLGGSSYAEIASTLGKALDTGFTTKPYTRVYGYVVKPVSSTKVSGERTSITGGVVT